MTSEDEDLSFLRPPLPWFVRWLAPKERYVVVRFVLLRLLALVYLAAFLVTLQQFRPLIGEDGLHPARQLLRDVLDMSGGKLAAFAKLPTLFWLGCSDAGIAAVSWIGIAGSIAALIGATNALLQLLLWALYLSIVQIGGRFYGYGWESQLCETGFLAIFLCPARTLSPKGAAPPAITIVVLRWLVARIMLGSGLIKIRHDECWRDLTCLVHHYETQPLPNPLSRTLHAAPRAFHQAGVLFTHLVELVAPFFAFGPRRGRLVAGVLFVVFQLCLIASGNLSFLNWLTIVPAIACFDDGAIERLLPARARGRIEAREPSRAHRRAAVALGCAVLILSVQPVANLLSSEQVMNRPYDPLRLVNTHGAFGTISRERYEVVLEGTTDETIDDKTTWLPYELPCKPGDPFRRPCVVSPYHLRVDWQMWFCGFRDLEREPWLAYLAYKLLRGDPIVRPLFARDPFANRPPRWIRAEVYWYRFTRPGERAWWRRSHVGGYMRPVRVDDEELLDFLRGHRFLPPP